MMRRWRTWTAGFLLPLIGSSQIVMPSVCPLMKLLGRCGPFSIVKVSFGPYHDESRSNYLGVLEAELACFTEASASPRQKSRAGKSAPL